MILNRQKSNGDIWEWIYLFDKKRLFYKEARDYFFKIKAIASGICHLLSSHRDKQRAFEKLCNLSTSFLERINEVGINSMFRITEPLRNKFQKELDDFCHISRELDFVSATYWESNRYGYRVEFFRVPQARRIYQTEMILGSPLLSDYIAESSCGT